MMHLKSTAKKVLKQASAQSVEQGFQRSKKHLKKSQWLARTNIYKNDCIRTLRSHTRPDSALRHKPLVEYIASSAPLHCADGWTLLGRALDAHTRRDSANTVHLAYYAELRAAIALLASQGIGVFDDSHIAVISPTFCQKIPDSKGLRRTHQFTWHALEYWSSLQRAEHTLGQLILPGGIPLVTWLEHFGTGYISRSLGEKWFRDWGLDLRRLSNDRNMRNQSSYRPTHLNETIVPSVHEYSKFMRSMWGSCAPSPPAMFDTLDRHLLRRALRQIYNSQPVSLRGDFSERISAMLLKTLHDETMVPPWKAFLTSSSVSLESIIFTESEGQSGINDPRHPFQVLSRAVILLRLATGACLHLFQNTTCNQTNLKFWWKSLGLERGLWKPDLEPANLTDLWGDIGSALEDLKEWELKYPEQTATQLTWRREMAAQIATLAECERVALWGMVPA